MIAARAWLILPGALLAAACSTAQPPSPAGRWEGKVTADGHVSTIAITLAPAKGGWSGTMDLPDDRLLGKPLGAVSVTGDHVSAELPAHDGTLHFEARISGGALVGHASAGQVDIPITLARVAAAPAPYAERTIDFAIGTLKLHGTILRPRGPGPFPGVILVHGSSTPDRSDYRYFADAYARRGFVALIYDKRDTGGEHDGGTASIETLASDAVAAASALAAQPGIKSVGYWGFSQGGWVAPVAAARFPFAFVAVGSAPGTSYAEVTIFANDRRLARLGYSPADRAAAAATERMLDDAVRGHGDPARVQAALDRAAATRWAAQTNLPRRIPDAAARARYLRWIDLDFDALPWWRRVTAPVLIAYGTADENVPAELSATRIAAALHAGGNASVSVHRYPGANHNLFPAPGYMRDLLDWSAAAAAR